MRWQLLHGDCRQVMANMGDDTMDSVVCDPPYHLTSIVKRFGPANAAPAQYGTDGAYARASRGFMGQTWDGGDVAFDPALWAEVLRVLKPGGHLIAFGGSRTYHRLAVAIEDAGFEIRDQIMWLYGNGFPKSLDVSKAIDATILHGGSHSTHLRAANSSRPGEGRVGASLPNNGIMTGERKANVVRDEAATDEAREWNGWGTALKPACEPIVLARKPLIGTVAANVRAHGTGALNIDGCRIGADDGEDRSRPPRTPNEILGGGKGTNLTASEHNGLGRWPANVCHDGSEEVLAGFPGQAGAASPVTVRNGDKFRSTYGAFAGNVDEQASTFYGGSGSAARFYYCAKASKRDRDEGLEHLPLSRPPVESAHSVICRKCNRQRVNVSGQCVCADPQWVRQEQRPRANHHPTVKPVDLMRWLCRLITPPGGVVFDPFTGSGSTGKAAMLEGFRFIGAELTAEYIPIAQARIAAAAGD